MPSTKHFSTFLGPKVKAKFTLGKVNKELVEKILSSIKGKSSSGYDDFSPKLMKDVFPQISDPLCHLFNLSFKTGFIPDKFKLAKVVPIFKSGNKNEFTNYRPISLLTSLSKILEKLVARQLVGYLYKNKILYKDQYGYRSGHSTTHPLLRFLDKTYHAFNQKNPDYCLGIFCDLKKAFDTVNFSILLSKL